MYDALSELKNKPICIGWVGDKFSKKDIPKGTPLDFIYFTDSGFFDLAVKNQLSGQLGYLPLACNPHYFPHNYLTKNVTKDYCLLLQLRPIGKQYLNNLIKLH